MSHATVLVVGEDHEAALAPFDEDIEVEQYLRADRSALIAEVRERVAETNERCYQRFLADKDAYIREHAHNPGHIRYLFEEFPTRLSWSDDECYAEAIKWIDADDLDENGGELSTYNPRSKWDWYQVGGSWDGGLVTTDGREVNRCTRGELDLYRTRPTLAVLRDGVWTEQASLGWFGATYDEQTSEDEWPAQWEALLADLPSDTVLTLIDFHI